MKRANNWFLLGASAFQQTWRVLTCVVLCLLAGCSRRPNHAPQVQLTSSRCSASQALVAGEAYRQDWETCAAGWATRDNEAVVVVDDSTSPAGGRVQKVDRPVTGQGGDFYSSWLELVPVAAGETYCLSSWVRWVGGGHPVLGLRHFNQAEVDLGREHRLVGVPGASDELGGVVAAANRGTASWQWLTKSFVMPVGVAHVQLFDGLADDVGKGGEPLAFFDNISLRAGACPPPAIQGDVVIDPDGYRGYICLSGACTAGEPRGFELAPGTHNIEAPYSRDAENGGTSIGSVSVQPDGALVLDARASRHFTLHDRTLKAKATSVTLEFAGYAGQLGFHGHGTAGGPAPYSFRFIVGRRYLMIDPYSRSPGDQVNYGLSYEFDVEVSSDGTAVSLGPETSRHALATGLVVRPKTVAVVLDHAGYPGIVGVYGQAARQGTPTQTIHLIVGRNYAFHDPYSRGPAPQRSDLFSTTFDVALNAAGDGFSVGPESARHLDAQGPSLRLKTAPVVIDYNGYLGYLGFHGLASHPGPTARTAALIRGRTYLMTDHYSRALGGGDNQLLSDTFDLEVAENGQQVMAGPGIGRHVTVDGLTVQAKVAPVIVDYGGYSGYLGFYGQGAYPGPGERIVRLLVGRRYLADDPYSRGIDAGDWSLFGGIFDVEVALDGASVSAGAISGRHFETDALRLKARTLTVSLDHAGYAGHIGVWGQGAHAGPGIRQVPLVRGRRYLLFDPYTRDLGPVDWYGFSNDFDIHIPVDGESVSVGALTARHFSSTAATLVAKTGLLTIQPSGFGGQVCLVGAAGACRQSGQGATYPVIVGRAYSIDPGGAVRFGENGGCSPAVLPVGTAELLLSCQR